MRVLVLDVDQTHNLKLKSIGLGDDGQYTFVGQLSEALELLNANPGLESKKQQMEKAIADGKALLAKTVESIDRLTKTLAEKKAAHDQTQEADKKKAIQAEMAPMANQLGQSEELKRKLEPAISAKQAELDKLLQTMVPGDQRKIDLLIVDRSFLGNSPPQWFDDLKKQITFQENQQIPVLVMGYNENIDYIKQSLAGGYSDYFVKPVDPMLFKFKASKLANAKLDDEKIFELQTKTDIKILKSATIIKMSEFEVELQSDTQFNEKDFVEFQADRFTGQKDSRILGRCLRSAADSTQKGMFSSAFSLIGLNAHSMVELRKWMRLQYVAQKKSE